MKLSTQEKQLLIQKYQKEGLDEEDIHNRIKEYQEFEEYVKFTKKIPKKKGW